MRADRLLSLILLLQTRGKMTTDALADELDVSRRTVLRDIEALSVAGIPIYANGGHGGGVGLDENYRTTLTGLKESEVRTLFLTSNATLLQDIGLGEAAEMSALKLLASLPERHQPSVDYMRQRLYIDPVWWWHEATPLPFWTELQQAVFENHLIELTYENYRAEVTTRTVEPYSLVAKASVWYLIGRRDGNLRTYRVARIQAVEVLDEHFERQADFDLPTYWNARTQEFVESLEGEALSYHFTIRLSVERVNFMKWYTPGRFEIMEENQEAIVVRLQVESGEVAKMLVFGFGPPIEVLDPPELQAAVLATAVAISRDC